MGRSVDPKTVSHSSTNASVSLHFFLTTATQSVPRVMRLGSSLPSAAPEIDHREWDRECSLS